MLYIGSSIGNFEPDESVRVLRRIRRTLRAGDALLLGADFAKSPKILIPAYDDAQGVTAAFNKNVLARLNRELEANFDLDTFRHVALWNRRCSRMEMHLESTIAQPVFIPDARPGHLLCGRRTHPHREQLQVHGRDDRIDSPGERLQAGAELARPPEMVWSASGAGLKSTPYLGISTPLAKQSPDFSLLGTIDLSDVTTDNQPSAILVMPAFKSRIVTFVLTVLLLVNSAWPWGNEGHMMINRVAAEKLPCEVPAFLRHAVDQLAYLGPEPDRWREKSELALKLSQEPDHFIDLELVEGMTLPPDRYSFYRALEAKRQQTPGQPDSLLPEKVGLQPYITMEVYGRLVVAFREYRHALRDHTNPEFAERNAIFYAGWLGHYVGDGANPLHTTVNYNGWTTANPEWLHRLTEPSTGRWKGNLSPPTRSNCNLPIWFRPRHASSTTLFRTILPTFTNRTAMSRRCINWRRPAALREPGRLSRGNSSNSEWPLGRRCCAISGTRRGSTVRSIRRPTLLRSRPTAPQGRSFQRALS